MLVVNSLFAITTPSFLPNAKLYSLKKKLKPQMEMQHLLFNQPFYVYSHNLFLWDKMGYCLQTFILYGGDSVFIRTAVW